MKKRIKSLIAAGLCICMIFTTACGGKDGTERVNAMGRFVETLLDYPKEGGHVIAQLMNADGTIDLYMSQGDGILSLYNSKDGEAWEKKSIGWTVPQGVSIYDITYGAENQVYLLDLQYADTTVSSNVYQVQADNSLKKLDIKWQGGGTVGVMANRIHVAESGDLFVIQAGDGIMQYGSDGSFKKAYGTAMQEQCAISGNQLYYKDVAAGTIEVVNIETLESEKSVAFEGLSEAMSLGAGREGVIYLYGPTGVFRLLSGGSVWEKIIDGDLTSFSAPTNYFGSLMEGGDGTLYLRCQSEEKDVLAKYVYNKTVSAVPENELVVYTLAEDKTLRQAATEFQRKYPDTRVNIQIAAGEESAATKADLTRALNTELLDKKGPDIILLDGLNADTYIEKGVLADLSDILGEMDYKETMVESVMNTYQKKDGIFAAPTKFLMPVTVVDDVNRDRLKDLNGAVELAQQNQSQGLVGNKSPERLIRLFMPTCAPAWLSGGKLDEKGLSEFLENMKKIADTSAKSLVTNSPDMEEGSVNKGGVVELERRNAEDRADIFHWAFNRTLSSSWTLGAYDDFMSPFAAIEHKGNGTPVFQPGQVEGTFVPKSVFGINQNTEQMESAKNFIKILLSDSVQSAKIDEGFPVTLKGLEAGLEPAKYEMYGSFRNPDMEGEELEGGTPDQAMKQQLFELCKAVKTPSIVDEAMTEIIINEAKGYFAGEKDIDKTISDIKEKTKLYLSE